MPYMAVGPDVRTGADTLAELVAKVDRTDHEYTGFDRQRIIDPRRPEYHVRYVDDEHPEYGETVVQVRRGPSRTAVDVVEPQAYLGGRALSDDEAAELRRLLEADDAR